MYFRQLRLGPMENFVYLLGDPDSREAAVVDPGWDAPAILAALEEDGYKAAHALVTHHHFDHVNGLADLLGKVDIPVHVHEGDLQKVKDLKIGADFQVKKGGERLSLGGLEIEFLHTPGHTPGSQSFLARGKLLSGDTLFINSCGRVDLPGGSVETMHSTLSKIAALPDAIELMPGHDYGDVPFEALGKQKVRNPFLQLARQDLAEFVRVLGR